MTEIKVKGVNKYGYKETKLGLIPKDWEERSLESIVSEINLGGNYSNDQENEGLPLIKMGNLSRGKINLDKVEYVSVEDEINEKDILKYGDLLFNTRNSLDLVGKVAVWRSELEIALYNSNLLKISFDSTHVYSSFYMNYLFNSFRVLMRLRAIATGTTSVAAIYNKDVMRLKLPLPPKEEQKVIVEILSKWDEVISKTEKLIKAKKRYKKGLMQRLLSGRVRFPEFEGEDWVEVKLGEVFDRVTEKNETELVKNVLTISAQDGLVSQTDYYNKSVASKDLSNYIVLNRGEFAYNKSYSEGYPLGAIKRLDDYEKGVLSPLYICFKLTSEKVDSDFITHFFEFGGLDHGIYKIAREGARNHGLLNVSVKEFFEIDLILPQQEEQKKIASVLNEAMKEIELLEEQLEKYQMQKKGLMQKLLTGKVRVN